MIDEVGLTPAAMVVRLVLAGVVGGVIGYERRVHHKGIGIGGMMLVAIGSAVYMLLGKHLTQTDPAAVGRLLQGFISGIGFLGGAVIFKGGTDVHGIKTAAAIWITGAVGLAIGTAAWWLGVIAGAATALILLVTDLTSRDQQQQEGSSAQADARSS